LDASVGYAKIARSAASEIASAEIEDEYRKRLSHVLGRDYKRARFVTSDVDQSAPLACSNANGANCLNFIKALAKMRL